MADNASITILRNTQANINAEPIKDGNILFTTDQDINVIYTDVGTKRIKIGGGNTVDDALSETSVNPVQNKVITNSINDVRGQICTNLLNPTAQTQTINGVTFTNNGDGTYTVNGTASETIYYKLAEQFTNFVLSRKYKIVGCPQGGSKSSYSLYDDSNNTTSFDVFDVGNGAVYTPKNKPTIYIYIIKGQTVNNLLFKPMLTTDLSATYDDFVQYSGDGELNENVAEIYKVSDRVSYETHTNLLNPTVPTQTVNGVTFTNNGDGTYTVNGTNVSSTTIFLQIVTFTPEKNMKCKFIGTPPTSPFGEEVCLKLNVNSRLLVTDKGSGAVADINAGNTYYIFIRVGGGVTVNNFLFKPMLTTDLSATYDDFVPYTGDSGRLNEDVSALFDVIRPVGSLYSTTDANFNPNTAKGWHGTWERIKDCVIYAAGDSDTVGSIVGSNTHTLTEAELPSHSHSIPALSGSTNSAGDHSHYSSYGWHEVNQQNPLAAKCLSFEYYPKDGHSQNVTTSAGAHTHSVTTNASTTGTTGSGTAIDMRPRRLNSIVWKRVS